MHVSRKRAVAGLSLAVAATGFLVQLPASANPAGTGLVISEVYGGGGNAGATFTHDFIELFNPTASAVSVAGMSVQYRSANGTSVGTNITNLSGSIPAGGRYLVQEASNAAVGAPLPTPDATGTIAMAGGSGQVLLVNGTSASTVGTGDLAGNVNLVDMVGYGAAGSFEGAPTGVLLTSTTSAFRNATPLDSDNNANDFSEGTPTPEGQGGVNPPPDEFTGTIAEIQGTGATSPHVDDIATTRGVVTAAYPTGGLNGFYIQTEGTGGATDETPGASDAIFVFGSAATATVAIGDFVEVVGPVSEFNGTTEIIPAAAADVTQLADPHDPVTPQATLPGSDCVLGSCPTAAELSTAREAHEGESFAPTAPYIAQNAFSLTNGPNGFMEIGLAASDKPLVSPTEIEDAQTGDVADVTAYNNAHAIALDDGSSFNYTVGAKDTPMPWITADHAVRVGAAADFTGSVVLEFRNNAWKLQPQAQITDLGTDTITFAQTRTATPEDVGGDLKLGTFNVLNYFNTTGLDYNATHPGACTFFTDRASNPITVNSCTPTGPRGAARTEDFERQQGKIVTAINTMDVDIVSLEEIENSIALGEADRDDAVSALVAALNADAGSTRWAFAPSPAVLPDLAEQDVIRTAFIYNPATVDLVGPSKVLVGSAAFANAREPLAQAFVAEGGQDADAFGVIVNHFKSKGSGVDDGTGQGNANPDRIAQANALVDFADAFKAERSITKIFLTGDFNAYSQEDPVQVLEAAGYTNLESDQAGEESYSFSGLSGSLDHVFANEAALPDVEGVDIWDINASESIAYQYGRFNYNATQFFDQTHPFGASDHNPELVGINADAPPSDVTLNLLGVNDFHGRINANTVKWAGTVEQLRSAGGEGNTLMIGAGDLIGASEFASAIAEDQPTIDMFNALDLDASAVGNHEFDKGWADLRDRVIGAPGAENAEWDYLGANVYADGTEDPVLPEYGTYEKDGLTIGVIGVVTEETSTLVSPGGITEIDFGNPTDAVNRVAGELSDGDASNGEADVIIASYHSGAQLGAGSTFEQEVAKGGEFAEMVNLDPAVDVIFNGHTHQAYAWDATIPGQPGETRPIIQTGEYGANVGQVQLTVDGTTGDVVSYTKQNVPRTSVSDSDLVAQFPRVANVKTIVDAALAHAAEVGNQPVGSITSDVTRALSGGSYVGGKYTGGTVEDRGSESALGDLVANALRDGLPAENGPVDLGIVNPGGLRADLKYAGDTTSNPANTDGVVTYAEANGVLPFVNNIWTIDLTGAQLKSVLEQQWQTNPGGPPPARPFLALGLSDNVRVTQDASKPEGSRITSVVVDGENLDPTRTYRVSTFSFLGTGGDNFRAFTQGTHADTGLVDRDLWIGYLQDHAGLSPDFARQQVAESGLPTDVTAGENVSFTLSKLNLTSLGAPENTSVAVYLRKANESRKIGDFPVNNGTATIAFTAPANLVGRFTVAAIAEPSVTQVGLPLTSSATSVSATADPMVYGSEGAVHVTVTSSVPSAGGVEVLDGDTVVGTGTISGGTGTVAIPGTALAPGSHTLTVNYLGDAQNNPSSTTVRVTVAKATSTVAATVSPAQIAVKGGTATVHVTVSATGVTPTGTVGLFIGGSLVGGAELTNGAADLTVGPYQTLGQKAFQVRYLGDDFVRTSLVDKTVEVVKATPTMTVTTSPNVIRVKKTKPVVTVRLAAAGFSPVTGSVRVVVGGDTYNKTLSDGTAVFTLQAFKTVGTKQINVTYLGTALTNQVSRTITVNVVR